MKRLRLPLLLVSLMFTSLAFSQVAEEDADGQDKAILAPPAIPDTIPFGVGERLRYHLDFSFMRAGRSEMAIVGMDTVVGNPVYHFRSRVRSTRSIDLIYKVRDLVESWFDADSLYSLRYERHVNEGNYHSVNFFDYNHETGWCSISNEHGPKGVTAFEPFSHNIISALYWVRTLPLEVGREYALPLHDVDVQYPLKIVVHGYEEVEVPAGRFKCWKVEPMVQSDGLFKASGKLMVWISDDKNRLPVMMKSKIAVGSIDGVLVEHRIGLPAEQSGTLLHDDALRWDW